MQPNPDHPLTRRRVRTVALASAVMLLASSAPALADVQIRSPRPHAPLPSGKVGISLRESGTVKGLRVRVDGKDITSRLRGTRSLTGTVDAKTGWHRVEASWRDAKGKRRRVGRDFVTGRRTPGLVRVVSAPKRSAGLLRLRVKLARGVTNAVVLVNGKRTELPSTGGIPSTLKVELGTRHGVRFGLNRVVIAAQHPHKRQYDSEQLTMRVARTQPLGAGVDRIHAIAKRPMRIDGRVAVPSRRGAGVTYRWRVVAKPKHAKVVLSNATTPRPRVTADRPGRYRLAVTVTERRARAGKASAAQTGPSTTQVVTMMNAPAPAPSTGLWLQGATAQGIPNGSGIAALSLGGTVYQQADQQGPMLLALDARTLAPLTLLDSSDNETWEIPIFAGGTPDSQILNSLAGLQSVSDEPMLVIIANQLSQIRGNIGTTLIDPNNNATYLFGYDPSKPDYGLSSGWSAVSENIADIGDGQLNGWLTRPFIDSDGSTSTIFTFRPGPQVPFDTQAATAPGSNTMQIGGQQVTATLPNNATSGFHLVAIDPRAGNQVISNQAYDPTVFNLFAAELGRLSHLPNATIFVQSIGAISSTDSDVWNGPADIITSRLNGLTSGLIGIGQYGKPGSYALVATAGVDAAGITAGNTGATTVEATPVLDSLSLPDHTHKQLSGYLVPTTHGGLAPGPTVQGDVGAVGVYDALMSAAPTYYDPFSSADEQAALQAMASDDDMQAVFNSTACYPDGTQPSQLSLAQRARASFCDVAVAGDKGVTDALNDWAGGAPLAGYSGDPATLKAVASELHTEFTRVGTLAGFSSLQRLITSTQTAIVNPGDNGQDVLYALTSALAQPAGGKAKMPDSLTLASSVMGFVSSASADIPVVGQVAALGNLVTSSLQLASDFAPPAPQPVTVDPDQLVTKASSQLDEISTALNAALDRFVSDPGKLDRAYENLYGGEATDSYPEYAADWVQTGATEAQFKFVWTTAVQTQLGAAYVGAAYQIYPIPVTFANTSYSPSASLAGPAQLQCAYTEDDQNWKYWSPFNGAESWTGFVPWDNIPTTNVLALWKHSSPEVDPLKRGTFDDNSGFTSLSAPIWNLLTGTGPGQWGVPPAALFLTSGMQVQPAFTAAQLAKVGDLGCTWRQS